MSNKTWGGRFKEPLHPLAVQFNASLAFDHVLYPYDILGSKAHALILLTLTRPKLFAKPWMKLD
jgi:argininosuccinate lyase